jgi:hypothetical protein
MKKSNFFIIVLTVFLSFQVCFAMTDSEFLSTVESNIFGVQYTKDAVIIRLNRIEKNIYGKSNALPVEKRIQKLKAIYPNLTNNAVSKPKGINPQNPPQQYSPIGISSETNVYNKYPALDELELKFFNKNFPGLDIYSRLDNLEMQVFKRKYTDSLDGRVERLKALASGNQVSEINPDLENSTDILELLNQLEKQSFSRTFNDDSAETRISRLENFIFGESSADASYKDRLDRLSVVIEAKKNSKIYDSNTPNQLNSTSPKKSLTVLMILLLKLLLAF